MVGRVVSIKMQKTAVVLTEGRKTHPLYKKSFKRSKKYLVDDPFEVKLGDVVIFVKIRPISKRKHWQITKVLGSDIVSLETAQLQESALEAIAEVMPVEVVEEEVTKEIKESGGESKESDESNESKVEPKDAKVTKVKKVKKGDS